MKDAPAVRIYMHEGAWVVDIEGEASVVLNDARPTGWVGPGGPGYLASIPFLTRKRSEFLHEEE